MSIDLLNMDCMDYMAGCEDNAFDLCMTSPPYNMNLRVNQRGDGYCSRQVVKEISTKYGNYSDNLPMDEYRDFLCRTAREILRVSDLAFINIQIITGNKPALFEFMGEFAAEIKEVIVWDKCRAQPAITEGVLNSGFELILVLGGNPIARAFKDPCFIRGTVDNVFRIPPSASPVAGHGATFPIEFANKILSNFARKGWRVFDPFMGTGTSAIAAHYFGCDFVGTEIDPDYFKAAQERFNNETKQVALF